MPGLLRGIVRTAVVAGTASAVSGRVQRHQAERFAERDAHTAAARYGYYQQDVSQQPIPDQRSGVDASSMLEQLQQLAELKSQGVLTEQEFADQKARILAQ